MVKSFTLWQGPPGTGKTRTLLALVTVFLATTALPNARAAMGPLLACADTNAAADNLAQGLVERGVRVVRVGNPAKVRASLRAYTVEAVAENDTAAGKESVKLRAKALARLNALREEKEALAARVGVDLPSSSSHQPRSRTSSNKHGAAAKVGFLGAAEANARADLDRADALLRQAMDHVLASAQVVCCTCTGAGDPQLAAHSFRVVVVDEATQATEPAVLVPLTRGAQCVVMAGDPQQLPPTVVSQKALNQGLDITLFDRVAASGITPLLLDTQYRMHPAISAFPAQHFYGGQLRDGVRAIDKPTPAGFPWPVPNLPIAFIEVEHGVEERANVSGGGGGSWAEGSERQQPKAFPKKQEGSSSGSGSYRNIVEAKLALRVVDGLVRAGGVASVAVLTPYRGQVRALESLMRSDAPHLMSDSRSSNACTSTDSNSSSGGGGDKSVGVGTVEVTVSSVDAYQGREADVVVFSAVRCNRNGSIGFVSDHRRLNVGITRPRRGLVLIGSPGSLAAGSKADWAPYLDWLKQQGVCVSHDALASQ